jgi:hypothetical protein
MSLFLRYEGRMRRNFKRALADFRMLSDGESGLETGPNEQ